MKKFKKFIDEILKMLVFGRVFLIVSDNLAPLRWLHKWQIVLFFYNCYIINHLHTFCEQFSNL